MKKFEVLLLIGLVLINLGFVVAQNCTDSDGGRNYTIQGILTIANNTFTDVCDGDNLIEYYCDGDVNLSETYNCPRSCDAGVCTACIENWTCTNWTECSQNIKYRSCSDLNNCGTTENKPNENQVCESEDDEDNETEIEEEDCWTCTKWGGCVNNTQTRICTSTGNCTEEKPKIVKKCELKKKIKPGNIECPEECTCTGSVIKCELASGRIMTVYAGKSGNVIVQIKGVNMSTNVTLYKNENGILEGIFKGNKTRIIKVLPDEAREKLKEKIKTIIEDEEIELDDYGFYKIKAHKKARFLFIIPVKENIEGQVDSETGNIIIIKKGSWWGFLARDVRE